MHELSLAAEICRIAERAVGSTRAARITAVGIELGAEAGVEPANLEFCLGVLLHRPPFGRAVPRLSCIPGADLRVTSLEVDDDGPDD